MATNQAIGQIDLTFTQRAAVADFLSYFEGIEDDREPLRLALVLAGEKPGTIVSTEPWERLAHSPIDFFDQLELAHGRVAPSSSWYVARDPLRISYLPEKVHDRPEYHRRLGWFFGYPQAAIDHFIEQDLPDRTRPAEFVAAGRFSARELAFSQFVFHVPIDSVHGYERAIERGKANRDRLLKLADRWELPALEHQTETVYRSLVDRLHRATR
ncbi:hypothetical protein [Halocatena pleomorpha]|uniref:Uncharacterized protein n=1 Tax=Halocatena pleomorpha TaxID=1785090 RepID=A0A3P3R7N5_9EURY|nr:hypothetical protein [Halocatena pleomorpha]RRJ28650.1 hypothetical protein EIK79_15280 [Halocatena pleomorpha]